VTERDELRPAREKQKPARDTESQRPDTRGMLEELEQSSPQPAVEQDAEVTPLELFFDLVFVFAITQVTSFLSKGPTWTRLLESVAILMALWFAWTGYAWLGNTPGSD